MKNWGEIFAVRKKKKKSQSLIYHKLSLSLSEISDCLIFPKYKSKLGNHGNHIALKLKFVISSCVSLCLSQSKLGVLFVTSSLSVTVCFLRLSIVLIRIGIA